MNEWRTQKDKKKKALHLLVICTGSVYKSRLSSRPSRLERVNYFYRLQAH